MLYVFAFLMVVAGALFRRWWGGWLSPNHFVKLAVAFPVALAAGLCGLTSITGSLLFMIPIALSFLNPFHSKYMRMGRASGTQGAANPGLVTCMLGMSLSYAFYTMVAALLASIVGREPLALLYAPAGLAVGPFYAFSWWLASTFPKLFPRIKTGSTYLFDGPTALGEFLLGATIIGALPVIAAIL